MRISLVLVALLAVVPQISVAAEGQIESCEQIRAKIGVLPLADPDLLRQLAARTDCLFTSGEAYRAAYGGDLPSFRATANDRRAEEDDEDHEHREHRRY